MITDEAEKEHRSRKHSHKDGADEKHKHHHHHHRHEGKDHEGHRRHHHSEKEEHRSKDESHRKHRSEKDEHRSKDDGHRKHHHHHKKHTSNGEDLPVNTQVDETPSSSSPPVHKRTPSSSAPELVSPRNLPAASLSPSQSSAALLTTQTSPPLSSPSIESSSKTEKKLYTIPESLADLVDFLPSVPDSEAQVLRASLTRLYSLAVPSPRDPSRTQAAAIQPIIPLLHRLQFALDINTAIFVALILSNVYLSVDKELTTGSEVSTWDTVDWKRYTELPAYWVGYYWQKDENIATKFDVGDDMQIKLRFDEEDNHEVELLGQGTDPHGRFSFEGNIHLITKMCKMRKWYTKGGSGKISSKFRGKIDDTGIAGVWGTEACGGSFRMRPANREEVRDQIEREKLTRETSQSLERELSKSSSSLSVGSKSISDLAQYMHAAAKASMSSSSSSSADSTPLGSPVVLSPPRPAPSDQEAPKTKKGLTGTLKRLFKKKAKEEEASS